MLSWLKGAGAEETGEPCIKWRRKDQFRSYQLFHATYGHLREPVTAITREMPLREAALLGCAFPTGAGMVLNTIKASEFSSLAVFGVGG